MTFNSTVPGSIPVRFDVEVPDGPIYFSYEIALEFGLNQTSIFWVMVDVLHFPRIFESRPTVMHH